MEQRVPARSWRSAGGAGHRPRLLVEDDDPVMAVSDFSLFRDAGFDVAFCSGPGEDSSACPLLTGRDCDLVARADVVLHGFDGDAKVLDAIRSRYRDVPVVLKTRRSPDGGPRVPPDGVAVLPFAASVEAQISACRLAAAAGQAANAPVARDRRSR